MIVALLFMIYPDTAKAEVKIPKSLQSAVAKNTKITYDSQGGYYVETLESTTPINSILSASSTSTKSKTKTLKYYNSNNALCWSYSLTASFKVNSGVSATYKSSSASGEIYRSGWSNVSESHSGSGSTASGTIRMKSGNSTISRTVIIRCSKNGTFS